MRFPLFVTLALVFAGIPSARGAQEHSAKAIAGGPHPYWPDAPDQAQVLSASFLGGKGTEWLSGGGFQADGTVVVTGNTLGPELDLSVAETIVGADLPKPGEAKPIPALVNGKPRMTKEGQPVFEALGWRHPNATGFVARLSPDVKKVLTVTRLPWTSAAITASLVDAKDGSIYIAGRATDGISKMGGDQKALDIPADATRKTGLCDFTFIAKLSPDGAKAIWVRTAKGLSDAPQLQQRADGSLVFGSQDLRVFDASGKQLSSIVVPGGVRRTTSVSPVDGSIIRAGEHNWGTGREPWRCPIFNVLKPDGTIRYELYNWGGPYVGLDNCRAVSDSAIRMVTHDRDGNILLYAWSDGGNSVMTAQPFDLRRGSGRNGLGLNSAGAGATSFSYLVRLDAKTFSVVDYTFWCTKYSGKANGIGIDALAMADDGTVCITGGAAWGLIQTKNFINPPEAEPSGSYIAVFSGDMTRARFVSAVIGSGEADIANDARWAIATGKQDGKARALFLCGAKKEGTDYGWLDQTPVRNPMQEKFGGGELDGYLILVDLSAGSAPPPPAPVKKAPPTRLTYLRDATRLDAVKKDKNAVETPDGAGFFFSATSPKYVTVDAEFRDAKGIQWPSYLCGRPVEGNAKWVGGNLVAKVAVSCPSWCQPSGDQDRRTIHQLIEGAATPAPLNFSLESMGDAKTEAVKEFDKDGKEISKTVRFADAKATLSIGDHKLAVTPKVTWGFSAPGRDGARVGIRMTAWFTFKGKEMGLKGPLADEDIDARISWTGQEGDAPTPPQPKTPAKKGK